MRHAPVAFAIRVSESGIPYSPWGFEEAAYMDLLAGILLPTHAFSRLGDVGRYH